MGCPVRKVKKMVSDLESCAHTQAPGLGLLHHSTVFLWRAFLRVFSPEKALSPLSLEACRTTLWTPAKAIACLCWGVEAAGIFSASRKNASRLGFVCLPRDFWTASLCWEGFSHSSWTSCPRLDPGKNPSLVSCLAGLWGWERLGGSNNLRYFFFSVQPSAES